MTPEIGETWRHRRAWAHERHGNLEILRHATATRGARVGQARYVVYRYLRVRPNEPNVERRREIDSFLRAFEYVAPAPCYDAERANRIGSEPAVPWAAIESNRINLLPPSPVDPHALWQARGCRLTNVEAPHATGVTAADATQNLLALLQKRGELV